MIDKLVKNRINEKLLLLLSLIYGMLLSISFQLTNYGNFFGRTTLLVFLVWSIFCFLHVMVCILNIRASQTILPAAATIVVTGMLTILRLVPSLAMRHIFSIFAGAIGLITVLLIYKKVDLKKIYMPVIIGIFALLTATLIFGVKRGGAISWIEFFGFGFQPSEVVKVLLILASAIALVKMNRVFDEKEKVVHSKDLAKSKDAWIISAVWAAIIVFLVFQKDLGTGMVFYFTCLVFATISTSNYKVTAMGLLIGASFAVLAIMYYPHVTARFSVWPNPWVKPNGGGYQILQSFFALAQGGIFGSGFSMESAGFIPASFTDMNFAVIGEQLGLIGTFGVIALIFALIYTGLKASIETKKPILTMIGAGTSTFLGVQSCIIIAGNLGIIPLTGVTLPLVSFGGTSMFASMTMLGMIMMVSAERNSKPSPESKNEFGNTEVKRALHVKKSIKVIIIAFCISCTVLICGCIYLQVISRDKLINDVFNPRIVKIEDRGQADDRSNS